MKQCGSEFYNEKRLEPISPYTVNRNSEEHEEI